MQDKSLEIKLRRWAASKNLILQKRRAIDKRDKDYNTYRLCLSSSGAIVFGNSGGYGKSLEEIEEFILKY